MELTISDKNIGKEVVGYILCRYLSQKAKEEVAKVQKIISDNFGDDVWLSPLDTLHVTLMDWLAPFVDYEQDKDALFGDIFDQYDKAIGVSVSNRGTIDVSFNKIVVTDSAVILVGDDGGVFNDIRRDFLESVELIANTKRPPQIVHSTICRFVKELPIAEVESALEDVKIRFNENVNSFDLVRATKSPMLDFSIMKTYDL
ncbi:MAG: hypothetical protein ACD_9C00323G0004 [uncultured bacterium]|nr:MAG: hypothetical protein ACD_9C00323G0004 [uncultured bacterium]